MSTFTNPKWLARRFLFRSVYKGPRVKGYWWLRRMALQSPLNKWARKKSTK